MPNPPSTPTRRRLASAGLAGILVLGAAACGSDDGGGDDAAPSTTAESTETTERSTDTTTSGGSSDTTVAAADGDIAEWAKPYEVTGDLLTTIEGDGFEVEVYQVGTATASKTGNFVNPDDNRPIIDVGDEIVYVNYVVKNTGTEAIPLSHSLIKVDAEYEDWPYMQGMDSVTDLAQYEEMKVNSSAMKPGSGEAPFQFQPGTTYAYGENFRYQAGSPIVFKATLTPADAEGDLVHDERQVVEANATIK